MSFWKSNIVYTNLIKTCAVWCARLASGFALRSPLSDSGAEEVGLGDGNLVEVDADRGTVEDELEEEGSASAVT